MAAGSNVKMAKGIFRRSRESTGGKVNPKREAADTARERPRADASPQQQLEAASSDAGVEAKRSIDSHLIALRAYVLWEARGRPIGSPEVDWFRAERELFESDYAPYARNVKR
jgi:hypothetical protein